MILAKCINNKIEGCYDDSVSNCLVVGKEYEVTCISMGQTFTYVTLKDFNHRGFNSVFFDFYEDGKLIDIYKDERFNPYLAKYTFNK